MEKEKLKDLIDYYKDDGLTIVGLNDSQGVNTTSTIFKKGLLEYLASELKTDKFNPTVINAFSLLMNKTEHINYFLKSNLSIEEIKLSKVYSSVLTLEKFMVNRHLPKSLGKIGYISTFRNLINRDDDTTCITSLLEEASNPIIIYSSGYSNLKREIDFDGVNYSMYAGNNHIPYFGICGYVAMYGNEFYNRFFGNRELKIFESEFSKFSTGRKKITYNKQLKKLLNKIQSISEVENKEFDNFYEKFSNGWEFYMCNDKMNLAEYHEKSTSQIKEIYKNNFSYLKLLSEMNYAKSNRINSFVTTVASIIATIIAIIALVMQ